MKTQGFLLKYPEGKSEINLEGDLPTKDLIVTTWQELKDKRDNGQLIPGSLYRITDYQCTTTQENTRSAGHQFDIVLLALSENKLAEEGWAMMHDNIYDVTFKNGVTKKCYLYCTNEEDKEYNIVDAVTLLGDTNFDLGGTIISIDEENKKAIVDSSSSNLTYPDVPYNYFQNSNLSAWKVWYCLDNDTDRFAWADDNLDITTKKSITNSNISGTLELISEEPRRINNTDYYQWGFIGTTILTRSLNPEVGDDCYDGMSVSQFGPLKKGTVTAVFPEHEGTSKNESVKVKTGADQEIIYYPPKYYGYPGMEETINIDGITYYIFVNSEHESLPLLTISRIPAVGDDAYSINMETGKVLKIGTIIEYQPEHLVYNGRGVIYRLIDEFNNNIKYDFKNIQFKRKLTDGSYDANGTETWCYTLNIWYNGMCQDASIVGNTLPNDEGYVVGVYDNNFGYTTAYDFYIEGVNTFAFALGDNVVLSFDDGSYYGIKSNIIGNSFNSNTIGNGFNSNTIGNYFYSNTIGDFFESNTIGSGFFANIIGNSFNGNTIGNYVSDNTIRDSFNANTIGNNFNKKTISDNTSYKNYGNNGVELATKDDIGNIETALNNI